MHKPVNETNINRLLRAKTNCENLSNDRFSDILVFGYACKLFRDDEKALQIDKGKHLIPWMEDKSLKIDRYDVRATLLDIKQYEAPPGGFENRRDYMSPSEQKAEDLCEDERYYSLYNNEDEEQMYKEEEIKRLQLQESTPYGQVGFNYQSSSSNINNQKFEGPDEIYQMPKTLNVPSNTELPETMRQHTIIEKTAKFISIQGTQMEILIKAKQSNNPQFEFLNLNNRLNPYYKYILSAFKDGTYSLSDDNGEINENNAATNNNNNTDTLLASLSNKVPEIPLLPLPMIKYKPSADCAYTQLISKIKGIPLPIEESNNKSHKTENVPLFSHDTFYTSCSSNNSQSTLMSEPSLEKPINYNKIDLNNKCTDVEIKKLSSGLMLAQSYTSDSEDENIQEESDISTVDELKFPIPPSNLQHVIDKTAAYVVRNGRQFENALRNKQDGRFEFLDKGNEFYSYYMYKVTGNMYVYPITSNENNPKLIGPVSFSIKSKDENLFSFKTVLPQEFSDDENSVYTHCNNINTEICVSNIPMPDMKSTKSEFQDNTPKAIKSRFDIDNTGAVVNPKYKINSVYIAPIQVNASHQKELLLAKEKVKDKLAQIAREKLGLVSKEKQLQLERKEKAAAFLNTIKINKVQVKEPQTHNTQTPLIHCITDESDTSSVCSVPIIISDEKNDSCSISSDKYVMDIKRKSRSRSKLRYHKKSKKSKHRHHSKKKQKKRSRSRSKSYNYERDHKHYKSRPKKSKKKKHDYD